jgi:hypothetical protein
MSRSRVGWQEMEFVKLSSLDLMRDDFGEVIELMGKLGIKALDKSLNLLRQGRREQ